MDNFISNASKFTWEQGIITVRVEERESEVVIQVADDGIGISEQLQPIMFDRFTRAKRPEVRGEKPIGLGMSITKHIVELHGGRIWAESRENQGTTVSMALPKV